MALSLKNIPNNNFLVLFGPDGNSQMEFINILREVFECYCVNLSSGCIDSTIEATNKAMKRLNKDTLFAFIDEIKYNNNKKVGLFKKLSGKNNQMTLRAKLIINSKHPLSFDDDQSIRDRILYMKFNKQSMIPVEGFIFASLTEVHSSCNALNKTLLKNCDFHVLSQLCQTYG
mmetsp:Transcript_21170/g.30331  ORF Transcript_21170/g.30331 Transcript_21170/m.30331 type:complete len:173 (+) Transcript_21170:758-1276(+)